MLEYDKAFGSTIKDTMKRVYRWSVYYYTSSSSYYPVPSNQIAFSDIPRLDPLPTVYIEKEARERLREWANTFGATVQC